MTDNGAEFGSSKFAKNKHTHPFELLLTEMQMLHKYTQPYRSQTNGKIERFWKTLKEDFIDGALYENIKDLKNELLGFLVYYYENRQHSSLGKSTPKEFAKNKKASTNYLTSTEYSCRKFVYLFYGNYRKMSEIKF